MFSFKIVFQCVEVVIALQIPPVEQERVLIC